MEAAIRFSRNSIPGKEQRFIHVDVIGKSFKLCKITKQTTTSVKYHVVDTLASKVPAFRAFDWHPVREDLVVVGQAGGDATLLNLAEGYQDALTFPCRNPRLCNAVALNSLDHVAVGLDRVRGDVCLNIWDYNQRLPAPGFRGFSKVFTEPVRKLASGEPISSLKYFHNDPQLLIAGVKGQFVNLYDLREQNLAPALQFATRCVHNLAIDWLDENYIASCFPSGDPSVCVWDRRMISRVNMSHVTFTGSESRSPELSLELKNPTERPGSIWSLRFSKAQRGTLGVLSSSGHLKVYSICNDFTPDAYRFDHDMKTEQPWETSTPQDVYLSHTQDIAKHQSTTSQPRDDKSKVVSFDFMTSMTKFSQSKILTLDGYGEIKVASASPLPEPAELSSLSYLWKGRSLVEEVGPIEGELGKSIENLRQEADSQRVQQTKGDERPSVLSSFDEQARHLDLGFTEPDVPLSHVLQLSSIQRLRCASGYLLDPAKNKAIVSDSRWLQSLWSWIERAARISENGNMAQDNFDLAHVGVYGLWMEDISHKNRTLGPTSNKTAKTVENLVRRLNIPPLLSCSTEYGPNRQICLHASGMAWSHEELESIVEELISQNLHTKAAALAMFAEERRLAYRALRDKNADQSHKALAMAIAGAAKRGRDGNPYVTTSRFAEAHDDWVETISAISADSTDPYARAILAYVRSGNWSSVVNEESLPLKYRVYIALRHLSDSQLTAYISTTTRDVIAAGDIEGVILTGTATNDAVNLMTSYVARFGDLQTAVLALAPTIPRYMDDEVFVRRYECWKETYRALMNSWGLKFDRVRFDIAVQKVAVDDSGRRLLQPAKQQVRLVCSFCAQSIAHSQEQNAAEKADPGQNGLTREKAAVLGTVCPKCGRHLPRCGVCDLWLGVPDETYLPWYGAKHASDSKAFDLSASMEGSIMTAIGPPGAGDSGRTIRAGESPRARMAQDKEGQMLGHDSKRSTTTQSSRRTLTVPTSGRSPPTKAVQSGTPVVDALRPSLDGDGDVRKQEADRKWDMSMARFTVLCVKCNHGCHASHARMWFEKHNMCPVAECPCLCNE